MLQPLHYMVYAWLLLGFQALASSVRADDSLALQVLLKPLQTHPQDHAHATTAARILLESPESESTPGDLAAPPAPYAPQAQSSAAQAPPVAGPSQNNALGTGDATAGGTPAVSHATHTDVHASTNSGAARAPASAPAAAGVHPGVTVVRTAEELWRETEAGARDIEIRSHLDLTNLTRRINPVLSQNTQNQDSSNPFKDLRIALMYAGADVRSIRGNCSNPDVADVLELPAAEAATLLPLKPRQCAILVSETFLMVNGGSLWVDNLYLKSRRTRVSQYFAFMTAGEQIKYPLYGVERSDVYVSNVTLQSEPRRAARGIVLGEIESSALITDSIFSDWDRELSPLRVAFRSVAAVRNTVFRNMRLSSEVADVSYGGTVHFNNTAFANVSLARGHVVSTTASDYESPFIGVYLRSYAEDDAEYDVDVAPLPRADAGVFGAEFEIADDLMSDCMYMVTQYDDESNGLQPGCPPRSVAQRWRLRKRSRGNNAVLRILSPEEVQRYEDYGNTAKTASGGLGVAPAPSSGMGDGVIRTLSPEEMQAYDAYYEPGEYEYYYAPAPAPGSEAAEVLDVRTPPGPATGPSPPGFDGGGTSEVLGAAKKVTDDAWLEEPQARYEGLLLSMDDAWFKNARAELPVISEPLHWPPFEIVPPPRPANRASLAEPYPPLHPRNSTTAATATAFLPPLDLANPTAMPARGDAAGRHDDAATERMSADAITAVACGAAALALVLVAAALSVYKRRPVRRGGPHGSANSKGHSTDTDRIGVQGKLSSWGHRSWRTARAEFATSAAPSTWDGQPGPPHMHDTSVAYPLWTSHGNMSTGSDYTWRSGTVDVCPSGFSPCSAEDPDPDSTQSFSLRLPRLQLPGHRQPAPQPPPPSTPPSERRLWQSRSVRPPRLPLDLATGDASEHATAGSRVTPVAGVLTEPTPAMLRFAPEQGSLGAYSEGSTPMGGTVVLPPYMDSDITRSSDACMTQMHSMSSTSSGRNTFGERRIPSVDVDMNVWMMGVDPPLYTNGGSAGPGWNTSGHSTDKAPAGDINMSTTDVVLTSRDVRALLKWLDAFTRAPNELFLGEYEMLGREHRRRGGQAVVQFARGHRDRCKYAVKFFLDRDAFRAEAALYAAFAPSAARSGQPTASATRHGAAGTAGGSPRSSAHGSESVSAADVSSSMRIAPAAAQFLPRVEAVCDVGVGGVMGPQGRPLPPCIVMEKGESLQDWSERAEPDLFASLAVISNISMRLADMHDAGYVHRDLKPANVMWLPRENRWTVIDFGCAAKIGVDAPLSFTLAYAAPEVASAAMRGDGRILSTPALDAWSLGVMAFELMTRAPAFKILTDGRCRVIAMLRGDLPLPWEGELTPAVHRKLGAFKGPVLQLLRRDPARRISMRRFHTACKNLVASRTTGGDFTTE